MDTPPPTTPPTSQPAVGPGSPSTPRKSVRTKTKVKRTVPPPLIPIRRDIPSHMCMAVLVTLFCCLPFGVVAIVKASQVNALAAGGNYAAAEEASDSAESWAYWSMGLGLLANIICLVIELKL